jgi:Na+/phosphate symporter
MMTNLAELVGGMGIFFIGVLFIGENVKYLITNYIKIKLLKWTRHAWTGSVFGFTLGVVTPLTLVLLLTANFSVYFGLTLFSLLPVIYWCNPASCLLIFFVFLNLKVLILYLIGIFGVILLIQQLQRFHTLSKFILGICFVIFGLSLVSQVATTLLEIPSIHQWFEKLKDVPSIGLLCMGAVAAFFAQGNIIFVLAVSLVRSHVLSLEQAFIVVCGAHIGFGVFTYTVFSFFKGIAKQVIMAQVLFNISLGVFFAFLVALDSLFETYWISTLMTRLSSDGGFQVLFFVLLINAIYALGCTLSRSFWSPLIQILFPIQTLAETIQIPRYVSPLLKEDVLLAGNAFIQEYTDIIKYFLPILEFSKSALLEGKNNLSNLAYLDNQLKELLKTLQNYLLEFQMQAHRPEISFMFLNAAYILEILIYLENSLVDKARYLHTMARFKKEAAQDLVRDILEVEEAVLLHLYETLLLRDDLDSMLAISGSKQSIIQGIRSKLFTDIHEKDAASLILLTDLFAREIWLINQLCDHFKKSPDYSIAESAQNSLNSANA